MLPWEFVFVEEDRVGVVPESQMVTSEELKMKRSIDILIS